MQERSKAPKIDVLEDDKEIHIVADLPGVEEKEISIEVNNGLFSLHGEKKEEKEGKHNNYRVLERSSGYFYRSFQLPTDVDESKIEATLKDGVLKVVLPKSAEARKHKKIEIKRL
jgi:HSP20 family protein